RRPLLLPGQLQQALVGQLGAAALPHEGLQLVLRLARILKALRRLPQRVESRVRLLLRHVLLPLGVTGTPYLCPPGRRGRGTRTLTSSTFSLMALATSRSTFGKNFRPVNFSMRRVETRYWLQS